MDREELTDLISDALSDSFDVDWTASIGARYVVDALVKENVQPWRYEADIRTLELQQQTDRQTIANMASHIRDLRTLLTQAGDFIENEADNRAAAGSVMSDYEREPRELQERIDAALAQPAA